MPGLKSVMADNGATYSNGFAATPICCPSRSSFQTGRYIHSVGVTNNTIVGGCSGVAWEAGPEKHNVAAYVQAAGYKTGYFGKYLNTYGFPGAGGVQHIPPGWDDWQTLVGYVRSLSNCWGASHGRTGA